MARGGKVATQGVAARAPAVLGAAHAAEAGALAPEILAAREATRLWGGLVDALGKDAYESVTVKVGRKTVFKSRYGFGVGRSIDKRSAGPAVRTSRLAVARWELLPLALGAAAAAGYAAAKTAEGEDLRTRVKGYDPLTKLRAKAQAKAAGLVNPLNPANWNPLRGL